MMNRIKFLISQKNFKVLSGLLLAVVAAAVINAFVFCNLSVVVRSGYQETVADLSDLGDQSIHVIPQDDGSVYVTPEGGFVEITGLDCRSKTISLMLETEDEQIIKGEIYTKADGHAYQYNLNCYFQFNADNGEVIKALSSQGKLHSINIHIPESESGVYIRQIIFNKQQAFSFNFVTFFVLCLIGCGLVYIFEKGWTTVLLDLTQKKQRLVLLGGILLPIAVALFLFVASKPQDETLLVSYEKGNKANLPIQQMLMFDSFHEGTVRLDLEVDPNYLLLDNIYDRSERTEKGYNSYWDMAFYNGSYYSYFGTLPIVAFYELFYILTGYLPGVTFQMFLFSIIGGLGYFAATYDILRYFRLRSSLFYYIIGNWALITGSFFFVISRSSEIYTIPIICGLACLLWGISFAYKAVLCNKKRIRILQYVLCGLMLVGTVALRPPVLLMMLAFIMPPFVKLLLDKELTIRQKLTDVASFGIPVLMGAVVIMLYNYARFDSPFEFGARYQLTVSDIQYNHVTMDFSNILTALYSYAFKGVEIRSTFPFLNYKINQFSNFAIGKYLYQEYTMGVFAFPFNVLALGVFMLPRKKEYKELKIMTGIVLFAALFLIIFDFGMGGLVYRYAGDFAIGFSMCAFIMLIYISSHDWKNGLKIQILMVVIIGITLLMGGLLLFGDDQIIHPISYENPNIYLFFANLFDI